MLLQADGAAAQAYFQPSVSPSKVPDALGIGAA